MTTINSIRGFRDIISPEIEIWQNVEMEAKKIFESFCFKEIRLPIVEKTELFTRSIGGTTDIVEKEMYSFKPSKDMLSLRPEATASIVRYYIQKKLYANTPIQKFYTIGPMFRRERPQKGRYRQFYQINAEVFGIKSPFIDALLIFILIKLFERLSITGLETKINSLGCNICKPKFNEALLESIKDKKDSLCENCKRRSEKNPLRILDCKSSHCKKTLSFVPSISDFLCDKCTSHFELVKSYLQKQNINYVEDKNLVRGLDYYTRTIFEVQTNDLGAQNAVAGGGRYDGLTEMLGGTKTPAIGFAIGLDRLCEILSMQEKKENDLDVYVIALDEKSRNYAFDIFCKIGKKNIKVDMEFSQKSLKSSMKKADKQNAKFVLIIGEKERTSNQAILRNMKTKKQLNLNYDDIIKTLNRQEKKNETFF